MNTKLLRKSKRNQPYLAPGLRATRRSHSRNKSHTPGQHEAIVPGSAITNVVWSTAQLTIDDSGSSPSEVGLRGGPASPKKLLFAYISRATICPKRAIDRVIPEWPLSTTRRERRRKKLSHLSKGGADAGQIRGLAWQILPPPYNRPFVEPWKNLPPATGSPW